MEVARGSWKEERSLLSLRLEGWRSWEGEEKALVLALESNQGGKGKCSIGCKSAVQWNFLQWWKCSAFAQSKMAMKCGYLHLNLNYNSGFLCICFLVGVCCANQLSSTPYQHAASGYHSEWHRKNFLSPKVLLNSVA